MLRRILPIRARSTPRRDVRGLTAEMEMIGMLGCVIRVSMLWSIACEEAQLTGDIQMAVTLTPSAWATRSTTGLI